MEEERTFPRRRYGLAVAFLHAAVVTWLFVDWFVVERNLEVPLGGHAGLFVQSAAAVAAIVNVWAWHKGWWIAVVALSLATLASLWGFLYFVPLLAVGLALRSGQLLGRQINMNLRKRRSGEEHTLGPA